MLLSIDCHTTGNNIIIIINNNIITLGELNISGKQQFLTSASGSRLIASMVTDVSESPEHKYNIINDTNIRL